MRSSYTQGDEPVPGFRLVSFLGAGPSSQVWKVTAPGGTFAALKIIRLNSKETIKELAAVRRFKQIRHPHLVPLIAFWLKNEKGKLIDDRHVGEWFFAQSRAADLLIAMGLADKSLSDRLQECQENGEPGIPCEELLRFLADAARGIDFLNQPLHDLGSGPVAIVHCDIKPQNILVAGNAAQICDLGIARVLGELRTTAPVGSAAYIAPEILQHSQPSTATDQYSLAISYYELRTGQLPLHAHSVAGAYFTHLQGKLDFGCLPEAERAIIARATALQPEERFPNCAAMVHALEQLRGNLELIHREEAGKDRRSTPSRKPPETTRRIDLASTPLLPPGESVRGGAAQGSRQYRWRVTLPLLLLGGAFLGSFGAWLTKSSAVAVGTSSSERHVFATSSLIADSENPVKPAGAFRTPDPPPVAEPFVIESSANALATLAAALSRARDGDTVIINGNGPFALRPLQIRGKALTIRAGPGFRPVLRWVSAYPVPGGTRAQRTSEKAGSSWQPLLATDRALTLQGLDLSREEKDFPYHTGGPEHFVWCQQAPLKIIDCRLRAPHGSAAIVCRQSPAVELRNCSLVVQALALCVEVAEQVPCAIRLISNGVSIQEPDGTALCVYASELDRSAKARLLLQDNTVHAGQLATFKALAAGVGIEARGNRITVGRAMLNFVGFPGIDGWRHTCRWKGEGNQYFGPAEWIQVDGVSASISELERWGILGDSSETGSGSHVLTKP